MKRDKLADLIRWKESRERKPLILRGARQTGKTWLLKEFGRSHFRDLVYINFEETPSLRNIFVSDFSIPRIINILQIQSNKAIVPGETLIVFDEIQSAANGLTSLKYFCENAPSYYVIAAGSLLGMGLHKGESFPVGKVEFLELGPMSFTEFLEAINEGGLADLIRKRDWETISVFHDRLMDYLKHYMFTGGMPEVVNSFCTNKDWELVRKIQHQILNSYAGDFSKHAPNEIIPRLNLVWQSIPSQLARENKKFVYSVIREGARAKDFEISIQWLVDCGLVLKCYRITKPYMPLVAYRDLSVFKLFVLDVGLLGAITGLPLRILIEGDALFAEFKGAITEQYVMQQLQTKGNRYIGYWTNERSTSEVDFIVQEEGEIIPIEVKSGENIRSKSFRFFCEKFKPSKAIRTSPAPYKEESWMINVPLYAI
jgi:hypothetical protein